MKERLSGGRKSYDIYYSDTFRSVFLYIVNLFNYGNTKDKMI